MQSTLTHVRLIVQLEPIKMCLAIALIVIYIAILVQEMPMCALNAKMTLMFMKRGVYLNAIWGIMAGNRLNNALIFPAYKLFILWMELSSQKMILLKF